MSDYLTVSEAERQVRAASRAILIAKTMARHTPSPMSRELVQQAVMAREEPVTEWLRAISAEEASSLTVEWLQVELAERRSEVNA